MTADDVTPEQLAEARRDGETAADASTSTAPDHPLLRLAWAIGFGSVDQVQAAVDNARQAGATWKQVAEITGDHPKTAWTKYGGGYDAQRRYRERKRQQD